MFRRVPSREVMRRAAAEVARVAAVLCEGEEEKGGRKKKGTKMGLRVLAVAGPGNNGGDALWAAAMLRARGFSVAAVFGGDAKKLSADARAALSEWEKDGGECLDEFPDGEVDLILDGLFGIGLTRDIEGKYAEWIGRMNASSARVLAVDAPSGLNADTGVAGAATVRADATATFLARKPGFYTADGPEHCGAIHFSALTAPDEVEFIPPDAGGFLSEQLTTTDAERLFPHRTAHKGSRGTLLLIGGARGMEGALILAARAAAGLGTGKVFAYALSPRAPAYDSCAPDVMWRENIPDGATAIGIGPGLGQSDSAREVLREVLAKPVPVLADADALNCIAADASLRKALSARKAASVLTPHPAEAGRLLQCKTAEIQRDRFAAARRMSDEFNADVVLKGAGSVLQFAGGEWGVNGSGNSGLARAGSGDVLSGFVSAFLAQSGDSTFALRAGVYLHGAAADELARQHGGPFGWRLDDLTPAAGRILNESHAGG